MAQFPRRLTTEEKRVMNFLLSPALPGAEELRDQIPSAMALREWVENLPSIDIMVGENCEAAATDASIWPINAQVVDEEGHPTGLLMLWLDRGRLSALEYAWYTEVPVELPPNELIILT